MLLSQHLLAAGLHREVPAGQRRELHSSGDLAGVRTSLEDRGTHSSSSSSVVGLPAGLLVLEA
jgi:hypothetical protein